MYIKRSVIEVIDETLTHLLAESVGISSPSTGSRANWKHELDSPAPEEREDRVL